MTDITDQIADLVNECHEQTKGGLPTRPVAMRVIRELDDGPLLRRLAAEFLVDALARARRAATLDSERAAELDQQAHESSGGRVGNIPRKGTRARDEWESNTPEGRAWAEAELESSVRSWQMLHGVVGTMLDRYAEDLRIKWTTELLDSEFSLSDGTSVQWGDATIEQHAERRQMFLNNAHANMEGAARHEVALRELEEAGAKTLREMVGVAA